MLPYTTYSNTLMFFGHRHNFHCDHSRHQQTRGCPEDGGGHRLQMGDGPHRLQQRRHQQELSQRGHQSGGVGRDLQRQPEGGLHLLPGVCHLMEIQCVCVSHGAPMRWLLSPPYCTVVLLNMTVM